MQEDVIKRVQDYLDKFNMGLKPLEFEESTSTCELAARALGVEVGQIAKSILFLADSEPVLIVASGDVKIKGGKLKKIMGASKVKMADMDTVLNVTGYAVGGVCPLALPQKLKILLEDTMHRFPVVYTAAGTPRSALPVTMEQLAVITDGQWADLA